MFQIFSNKAEDYDNWYIKNKIIFECEAKVIKSLNLQGDGLSVGVGTGILDSQTQIKIGIDPAFKMLKFASARGIKGVQAIGEYLPFRNESFDFVLISLTICFLNNPKETISEIYRVLHLDGELAVCIIPKESPWGKLYMKKAKKGHIFYRYAHFFSLSEIKSLLEENFFKITVIKSTLSFPPSMTPTLEEPTEDYYNKGFVCVKAIKI
ncbi:MAG: class I SAM-dependent methyltransferase [Promethearchaeota archaeon]